MASATEAANQTMQTDRRGRAGTVTWHRKRFLNHPDRPECGDVGRPTTRADFKMASSRCTISQSHDHGPQNATSLSRHRLAAPEIHPDEITYYEIRHNQTRTRIQDGAHPHCWDGNGAPGLDGSPFGHEFPYELQQLSQSKVEVGIDHPTLETPTPTTTFSARANPSQPRGGAFSTS